MGVAGCVFFPGQICAAAAPKNVRAQPQPATRPRELTLITTDPCVAGRRTS